jgi:hypothetical protein
MICELEAMFASSAAKKSRVVPMSNIDWIIVLGLCGLGTAATWLWRRHSNLAAVLMVVGITALGIFVSALRMPDPRTDSATEPLVESVPQTDSDASQVALATRAPVNYPSFGPMVGVATGGAAPAATTNPYALRSTSSESPRSTA